VQGNAANVRRGSLFGSFPSSNYTIPAIPVDQEEKRLQLRKDKFNPFNAMCFTN